MHADKICTRISVGNNLSKIYAKIKNKKNNENSDVGFRGLKLHENV